MNFDDWMRQAWSDHADDAAPVAARLAEGAALAGSDSELSRLAHLSHHVLGEHLGRWHEGITLLQGLRGHAAFTPAGDAAAALGLYEAALALGAGQTDTAALLTPSDRIRAQALAAAALGAHDTPRALGLFQQALAETEAAALPERGPHARTLAASGNGLACALEEKPQRSAAERELMILAAQTARRFWALAGGWLETERAEYRLAHSWRHAGDPAAARHHAQLCLEIVAEHGNVPLERFFGCEALGLAERAAGNSAGHTQALVQAREAFAALEEGDRGWCQASLDKLAAA